MYSSKKKTLYLRKAVKLGTKKSFWYALFIILSFIYFLSQRLTSSSNERLNATNDLLKGYDLRLKDNVDVTYTDSLISSAEREHLINAIERKIVGFLYQVPDYSFLHSLEAYLQLSPELLNQIPSTVPLENGDYYISGTYGFRQHPIYHRIKKHNGIDLAAPLDSPVYASASGTVQSVLKSDEGYGNHIIIRHRFGFKTLYGHLNKILVEKGQAVNQHDLLATVGSSGATTGNHLHYEVIKNKKRIDPIASFSLKSRIITQLVHTQQRQKTIGDGSE